MSLSSGDFADRALDLYRSPHVPIMISRALQLVPDEPMPLSAGLHLQELAGMPPFKENGEEACFLDKGLVERGGGADRVPGLVGATFEHGNRNALSIPN